MFFIKNIKLKSIKFKSLNIKMQSVQSIQSNIDFIGKQIINLLNSEQNNLTWPSLFEYGWAYILTIRNNKPHFVWKDITPFQKETLNVPIGDKGID